MSQPDVWILAANAVMARALEVERWVEVFSEHGIALKPQLSSRLRLIASQEGPALANVAGEHIDTPRLCIARVYEPEVPRQLELMGCNCQAARAW